MRRSQLHFFWRDRSVRKKFRTGVSLHSDTLYSEETLAFIPRYTDGIPFVGNVIRRQQERHLALTGANWTSRAHSGDRRSRRAKPTISRSVKYRIIWTSPSWYPSVTMTIFARGRP